MMVREASKIRSEAHHWRARSDDGFNEDEEAAFKTWYDLDLRHREAFAEAEFLWSAMGAPGFETDLKTTESGLAQDKAHQQLPQDPAVEPGHYQSAPFGRFVATAMALAACVAAALFLNVPSALLNEEQRLVQTFATERGVTRTITLPDSSTITLAPGSQLEVTLTQDDRQARLKDGDAHFDVASDAARPFLVSTAHLSVRVTGTQFGVKVRPNSANVAVGEGSVEVRPSSNEQDSDAKAINLVAGQGIGFETAKGFGAVTEVFPVEVAPWRDGLLTYSETPLSDVVRELNRYSKTPIEVDQGAATLTISGTFKSNDIAGLLSSLEGGMPVKLERQPDGILIRKR